MGNGRWLLLRITTLTTAATYTTDCPTGREPAVEKIPNSSYETYGENSVSGCNIVGATASEGLHREQPAAAMVQTIIIGVVCCFEF